MSDKKAADASKQNPKKEFLIGLARAFAGAIIFSFSIIMTSEMWWLGFTMARHRLAIFILLSIPNLILLAYFIGYKKTVTFKDAAISAFVAMFVGYITAAVFLFTFGLVDFGMSWNEILGKVTVQGFTAAFGALFAQSQLGTRDKDKKKEKQDDKNSQDSGESESTTSSAENSGDNNSEKSDGGQESEAERLIPKESYFAKLFLMSVGAIFLAMNPAATIEMPLISYKMMDWQFVFLGFLTLILMHGFVYSFKFRGQNDRIPDNASSWSLFLRYTVVGYAIALGVSAFSLWAFGTLDGLSLEEIVKVTLVLGFPAGLGAAASRIIL